MKRLFTAGFMYDVGGIFLVAVLPLVIFLKHSDYFLLAPEIMVICGLILVFAVVCGLLMVPGRVVARVAIFAWLGVLIVDIQTDWITTLGLRLLLNSVFFGVLFWFLRRHLAPLLLVMAGLMVLATAVMPGRNPVTRTSEPAPRVDDDPDLPFVLHLILDEQIGIEGIPAEFDPEGETAAELRDFYLDNSFAVYGRAYSRYTSTRESIPNLLNFACAGERNFFLGEPFHPGILLRNNLWFDLLHERGYRIHVVETGHVRFFDPGETGVNPYGDTRLIYDPSTLKGIETADLTVGQKIPFILSTYFGRSFFLKLIGKTYADLAFSSLGGAISLPRWDLRGNYPGALNTMQVMDILEAQLRQAGPGQAVFAHLMIPHSPYGFDRDCNMELQPGRWLYSHDYGLAPRNNTPAGRAVRYPLYLGQVFCLQSRLDRIFQILKDKGLWEQAVVIIHGDHGSRISLWPPVVSQKDKLVPADYMDSYSTLFVVKGPGIEAGYHHQLLSIDHLLGRLLRDGLAPDDPELEADPWVYLMNGDEKMVRQPLPRFAHGRIIDATPEQGQPLPILNLQQNP